MQQVEVIYQTTTEAHTFFVGDGEWLVHNCSSNKTHGNSAKSQKKQHGYEIDRVCPDGKSVAGWRDDFLGHKFPDGKRVGSHVNAWAGDEGIHLFYPDVSR